jgi:predicted ribosomally synthesized peptide with SipW-like signal peptide
MTDTKRKTLVIVICLLCVALAAGGSFAYFTAEETAHNVINMSDLDIDIQEWANDDMTEPFPEDGITNALPGTEITKIATVKNTSDSEAWVRVKLDKSIILADGVSGTADTSLIILTVNTAKWTERDGYYYYNEPLAPGAVTEPVLTKVTISKDMNDMYKKSTVKVDVIAQAVQTANNGSSALEAVGWPA